MRKKNRRLNGDGGEKNVLYLIGTVIGISIIAFIFTVMSYNNNDNKTIKTEQIAEIVTNTINSSSLEQVSTQIGKSVEEVKEEAKEAEKQVNIISVFDDDVETNNINENLDNNEIREEIQNNVEQTNSEVVETKKLEFILPVTGDIIKEYAKENLIYSETLNEWTTHQGIDIESEKTTIVKAAEDGEIIGIKNDPRYGITVIIRHQDGFETRYANLLTAEFVKEGEMVVRGQTIGTVGNSAAFEILDPFHLHFEMLKDGEYVNPENYIK